MSATEHLLSRLRETPDIGDYVITNDEDEFLLRPERPYFKAIESALTDASLLANTTQKDVFIGQVVRRGGGWSVDTIRVIEPEKS